MNARAAQRGETGLGTMWDAIQCHAGAANDVAQGNNGGIIVNSVVEPHIETGGSHLSPEGTNPPEFGTRIMPAGTGATAIETPHWSPHSGMVPEAAATMGLGAVRRIGTAWWHKSGRGVFYTRGLGQDGDPTASDAVNAAGADDSGAGAAAATGAQAASATPGGGPPTSTNATPGGATGSTSSTSTTTSTTTTPATNYAVPILATAGVFAAGIVGWGLFSSPKKRRHAHR